MKHLIFSLLLLQAFLAFGQTPPPYPGYNIQGGFLSGYTFMTYQSANPLASADPALLLFQGNENHLVYYQPFAPTASGDVINLSDFKLLPNGKMAYYELKPGQSFWSNDFGKYYLMDQSFTVVDSVGCDGRLTDVHDLQMTPSGNYILLCTVDSLMDLSGITIDGQAGYANTIVRGQGIQEVTPAGNAVFEWNPFDENLVSDMYDEQWTLNYDADNLVLDWTHLNSVEYDYDGNFIISARHFNQIQKIDRTNNEIMWRLGGKRNDFGTWDDAFTGQHDARRKSNGNLTLFNNAQFAGIQAARPMEFFIDENQNTALVVDQYFYNMNMISLAMGSNRELPGLRFMACYGANVQTTTNPLNLPRVVISDFFQLPLMEFFFNDPLGFTYRAHYESSLPFALNRSVISVSNAPRGRLLLDAGVHSGYRWSTGQTTRFITVSPGSSPEDYFCYVPYGDGFLSSEILTIGGSSKQASTSAAASEFSVTIAPNPSQGPVHFQVHGATGQLTFKVLDLQGKVVHQGQLSQTRQARLDLSALSAGMYMLEVSDDHHQLRKRLILQ